MQELDVEDHELVQAAEEVLRKNFDAARHTVGAAVRCASGRIYSGVNLKSCGYAPCAEPIAIGIAVSSGEREIESIVSVIGKEGAFHVLPPCGNCRQLLLD